MREFPQHLGVILDGNRRWAKAKNLPPFEGHRRGAEKVEELINWSKKKGIKILTLFVFSTENWKRSKREVAFIMKLLGKGLIDKNMEKLYREGIRIRVVGQKDRLPKSLQKKMEEIENLTKKNREMTINFALSYGGRAEIVEAIKKIIEKKIPLSKITEEVISKSLWTTDLDLIIRTGEELRISNFLIWQAAYSELYFCKKYWPDFSEKDLDKALTDYALRQRRFGA